MPSVRWGRNSRVNNWASLAGLLVILSVWCLGSAWAQTASGTHVGAVNGSPTDAEYLLNGSDARLPNAHPVTVTSPITKNSPAPGGNFTLGLDTVPLTKGGSGQITRQAGINAFCDSAGSTSQDLWYFDGTNWTRFARGSSGQFLGVNGSNQLYWTTASVGAIAQTAQVLVLTTDATAPNGRVFTLTTGLSATDLGAGSTYTLGVDSTVLTTTSTQTGITNKTFTLPSFAYNSGSGVALKGTSFDSRLKWADWAAARNITIPDPGADANVVTSEGNATINGTKTFSDLKLSGTTFKTASNTITVPAADDTLVNLGSTQSITGTKTITRPVFIASSSSFWRASQGGFFTNFKVAPPAADRDITFPEVANNSNVVLQSTSATHVAGGIHYDIDTNGLSGVTSAGSSSQPLLGGTTPAFGTLPIGGGGTNNASLAVTQGTVYYGDGSKLVGLAPGTSGYFLKTQGASANPVWDAAATVSTFSASPSSVFDVANATTTPALSLDNQNAFYALRGPTSGSATTPAFRKDVLGDTCGHGLFGAYLTLESGVAGSTTDQTAKSTLYLTTDYTSQAPGVIDCYDGSVVQRMTLASGECSALVTGLTADKNYDVFCYDSDSNNTIDALDLVVWTDDSTRATALGTTTNLGYTKSGTASRRYCGTIRTYTSSGTKAIDSAGQRYVWNLYNQKKRHFECHDTTDSWSLNGTWRPFNNSTTYGTGRVGIVSGLATNIDCLAFGVAAYSASAATENGPGIGVDSTTTVATGCHYTVSTTAFAFYYIAQSASLKTYTAAGFHFINPLEQSNGISTTFYGDSGASMQSGLDGTIFN